MRAAFVEALGLLLDREDRVVVLTADLGYNVLEPLFEAHPDRVFNVGAAEQNMAGVAAGMAQSGLIPFIYSIATFASLRGYEFIRNGALVHNLPVRVVGIGGGFEYGAAGISHYALEDFAVMRAQPGMIVVAPADGAQAVTALAATWERPGPVYYRIGKSDRPPIPGLAGRFRLGRAELLQAGSDVVLIATGTAARAAYHAARRLNEDGVSCAIAVVACVAPPPVGDIAALVARAPLAVTLETHFSTGGLGSLVAEVIAEQGAACRLVRCAVNSCPTTYSGSQEYMERRFGLDADSIVDTVRSQLAHQWGAATRRVASA